MPEVGPEVTLNNPAFVHPTTLIYGKVFIDEGVSLWPYSVIRSEMFEVRIGKKTNIQDFVMIHVGNASPTIIGENCSITHHCTIHGATIGNNCLIGINATIMDGVTIGNNCIVGGHTIVTEGSIIPDNSIVMGSPGKVVKTRDNSMANIMNAAFYYENGRAYARGEHRVAQSAEFKVAMALEKKKLTA